MKITFHGAARTVTGSLHMITVNSRRLLLECGLYQGSRRKTYERNLNFPFDPTSVDAVILSHAHIDHSGNLPNLVRQGFKGPIHATHATTHLVDIMLRDSGHIHESDAAFVNRKRARRGEPPVEPLYTVADASRVPEYMRGHDYDQVFEPIQGVKAEFVEAGHILGSAGVVLEINENGRKKRLMFSGDIGRRDFPILRDPRMPVDVDFLIMECTYGDRLHDHPLSAYEELRGVVQRTVARGGKIIIPAFAVGRTQTLVYYLHQMIEAQEIPRLQVFVDSPLAINITEIFRSHPECFDRETVQFMETDPHGSALGFDLLSYTRSVEESKAINDVKGPVIIISASGMAEAGRILHHLRNNLHDPRNTVLITSWMAPHTLGRRLAEGDRRVRIFGEEHQLKSEVACINGLSAHGDQGFLLSYAAASRASLRKVFLVHGEEDPAQALMHKLRAAGHEDVVYPAEGEEIEI